MVNEGNHPSSSSERQTKEMGVSSVDGLPNAITPRVCRFDRPFFERFTQESLEQTLRSSYATVEAAVRLCG